MELRSKTILLVEDDAMIALLEKCWLVKEGFHVIHVTTGEKAIELFRTNSDTIDLILMDIDLGTGIDGTETAREILKDTDIPLLFLSSHTEPELVKKTEEISSYGYVVKGSSNTVLLASIRMAFRLYQAKLELKEKAEAIQAEKQKAEQYLDVAEVILGAIDTEGRIILINRKGCQVLGYEESELIGRKWPETFLAPEEKEKIQGVMKDLFSGKLKSFEYYENHIITKSGEKRLIEWHNTLLRDKDGNITGILSSGNDITEKKKALISRMESERNFRLLVESLGEGVAFLNPDETFAYFNPAAEAIFGVEPGEIAGKQLTEFQDEEELSKARYAAAPIFNKGKAVFETGIISKDGQKKTILLTVTPRFNESGEMLGTLGVFRDITSRKEAHRKLKESEQRLSDMAKNVPGFIYQYTVKDNGKSHFSYLSDVATEMLGLSLNMEDPELTLMMKIPEKDQKYFIESIKGSICSGTPWEYEGEFISNENETKWYQTKALPTRKGDELIYNGIAIDITDRKNAELLQQKYSEDLRLSNATKDKFFSIIAHDLRSPFSGFIGLSDELMNNVNNMTREEISEIASAMNSTSKRTFELLTNLLDWSRLQTDKIVLKPAEENLFETVCGIQALFVSAASKKSVSIESKIALNKYVYADSYSLTTILRNLISNAVKFTPSGGKVIISSERCDGFVDITVSDTGIGMTNETLEKAFRIDSGYTTFGTNGEEGTGLGLVLCKEIAEKNLWEMEVKSRPGEGTTFTLRLPSRD